MRQWLVICLILFVQETVTINGLLVKAHQGQYSLWWITLIFVIASVIDIVIGYAIGHHAKKHLHKRGMKDFAAKWSHRFRVYIGKHGRKVYLLLLGYFSFPYLNAFITAWLNIPFWESFWYVLIGNILFYITSLLLVLGVSFLVPNPYLAFVAVILVTVVITVGARIWKSRKI